MTQLLRFAGLVLTCVFLAPLVHAQATYPNKPIRVVIPAQPGGGFDAVGRALGEKMSLQMGQAFVMENRTGAGTVVGTDVGHKAAPDGYTLVVGSLSNLAFNPALYTKLPYDVNDFTLLGIAASYSYTLVGRKDLPANNLRELIDHARANPGKLTYVGAVGTGQQVAAMALFKQTGVDVLAVPYKSNTAAYPDVIAGRVDLFFDNTQTIRPYLAQGVVKAFATSSIGRDPILPNVPTVNETGITKLELESWFGLFVHRKTPSAIIERLRAETATAIASPEVIARLEKAGGRVWRRPIAEQEAMVRTDMQRWTQFIRDAGVRLD
jgi:tripartite-type tricarboxylate transporter receptor subunit TctC